MVYVIGLANFSLSSRDTGVSVSSDVEYSEYDFWLDVDDDVLINLHIDLHFFYFSSSIVLSLWSR
jgi:hypothetical protein